MGEPLSSEQVAEIRAQCEPQQTDEGPLTPMFHAPKVLALCDTVDTLRAERDGIARRIRDGWEPDVLLPEPPDWSGRWVRVDRLDARTEEEQGNPAPWWRRMSETADSGELPDICADIPASGSDAMWRRLLGEYVYELANAMDEQEAELETLRGIARRIGTERVVPQPDSRWHRVTGLVASGDDLTEAEVKAIFGRQEEESDGG